jgi:cytidyltransferase-like protein
MLNFQSYITTGEQSLTEGLKVNTVEHGKKLVNIFVGRFQPFTLGHAKVIETIYKQNGYPVVIFLIKSKTKKREDAFSRPYDEETQLRMLKALQGSYPIQDVFILPSAGIDLMFNQLRPKYEPVLWGTGTDRMKTYAYQVDREEYRTDLNVRPDFGLFEIPRDEKAVSATQVRNALLDDDEKIFRKLTPRPIHQMYGELRDKLTASMSENKKYITTMKHIKLFEGFINSSSNDQAKKVMKVASPKQKKVLNDFQTGTEFLFLMSPSLKGEITVKSIDDALKMMVGEVEGDISQLEPEHAKYAEKKGWLKDYETEDSLDEHRLNKLINMKHIKLFEEFSKTLNEGISSSDQKKLEAFATKMSEEIIDANQNNKGFNKDEYSADAMLQYLLELIDINSMTVKEIISDYNWEENTMELGL